MSQRIPLKISENLADVDVDASVEKISTQLVRRCAFAARLVMRKRSHLTPGYYLWKKVYKSFQVSD
jgi:hypothetical protein